MVFKWFKRKKKNEKPITESENPEPIQPSEPAQEEIETQDVEEEKEIVTEAVSEKPEKNGAQSEPAQAEIKTQDVEEEKEIVAEAVSEKSEKNGAQSEPAQAEIKTQDVEEEKEIVAEAVSEKSEKNGVQSDSNGLFKRLKSGLAKTRTLLTTDIDALFADKREIDDDFLEELEEILITADIGAATSMELIEYITQKASKIKNAKQLKEILREKIIARIDVPRPDSDAELSKPHVIMVIGVNGVGKTTTIGKLATKYKAEGKKVLIAAADTFRAAAIEQLVIWAEKTGVGIVKHRDNADPSAVAFDAVEAAMARNVDIVIVDTAGRLHTKVNLMQEIKKIKRTIAKKLPQAPHEVLLVLDATTGQNAISQTKQFNEALGITGLVLAKLDGTARGGIAVPICSEQKIPLRYIGTGEQADDLEEFNPGRFADALLGY
ncbi:signal recognition particle-docking protein FtsY [Desulfococcaceae bacterium HSG9]|nr:signal recognition particle-docking protein FtsY [Desulfococcaceae bacterium HSG9]